MSTRDCSRVRRRFEGNWVMSPWKRQMWNRKNIVWTRPKELPVRFPMIRLMLDMGGFQLHAPSRSTGTKYTIAYSPILYRAFQKSNRIGFVNSLPLQLLIFGLGTRDSKPRVASCQYDSFMARHARSYVNIWRPLVNDWPLNSRRTHSCGFYRCPWIECYAYAESLSVEPKLSSSKKQYIFCGPHIILISAHLRLKCTRISETYHYCNEIAYS